MSKENSESPVIEKIKHLPMSKESLEKLKKMPFDSLEQKKIFVLSVYQEVYQKRLTLFHDFPSVHYISVSHIFMGLILLSNTFYLGIKEDSNFFPYYQIGKYIGPSFIGYVLPILDFYRPLNNRKTVFINKIFNQLIIKFELEDICSDIDAQKLIFLLKAWYIENAGLDSLTNQLFSGKIKNEKKHEKLLSCFWEKMSEDFNFIENEILKNGKKNHYYNLVPHLILWGMGLILIYYSDVGYSHFSAILLSTFILMYNQVNALKDKKEYSFGKRLAAADVQEIKRLIQKNLGLKIKLIAPKTQKKIRLKKISTKSCWNSFGHGLKVLTALIGQIPGLTYQVLCLSFRKTQEQEESNRAFEDIMTTEKTKPAQLKSYKVMNNRPTVKRSKKMNNARCIDPSPLGENLYLPLSQPKRVLPKPKPKSQVINSTTLKISEEKPLEDKITKPAMKIKNSHDNQSLLEELENQSYELQTLKDELFCSESELILKKEELSEAKKELEVKDSQLQSALYHWGCATKVAIEQAFQLRFFGSYNKTIILPARIPENRMYSL